MISVPIRQVALAALISSLAACESMERSDAPSEPMAEEAASAAAMTGASERTSLKLLIGVEDPNVVMRDPDTAMADAAALRTTLNEYDVPEPAGMNFRQWITRIKQARGGYGAEAIGGLGGVTGRMLLWLAGETLDGNGDFAFEPGASVHGQIEAECDGQPGYVYDATDGSGRLCVTVFTTKALGASGQTRTRADRFLVLVDPGGFHVEAKDIVSDPDTAFPDFTAASGLPISHSVAANFDTKLWASGTSIHVVKLWRDENYDENNPNFHEINLEGSKYNRSLKAPNEHACIDMMFVGQPPATYADLQGPPQYCLGRCDDPPIINTR